jgi:hypothetical protein
MMIRRIFYHMIKGPFIVLLFSYAFLSLPLFSQSPQTIDLKEIPQKKVRHYIEVRKIDLMQNFSFIHASWKKNIDPSSFHTREKTFYIKDKLPHVWECYRGANPTKSWTGHFVTFGLLLTKYSNSVEYLNNCSFPQVDTGQVYFLNLRLIGGLFNIPVAFEIINIDTVNRKIEFSYLEGNKSQGKQIIQFIDNEDGYTKIIHRSFFKSNSPLRDILIYPHFHKKLIEEFHRNMKALVLNM